MGYLGGIEEKTLTNEAFRRVLHTAKNCQLVVMSLLPGEDMGEEVHRLDQFVRFESGSGTLVMDGRHAAVHDCIAVIVPAGTRHNITNTGTVPLKLYTIYATPQLRDGVVHSTRADARADARARSS